MLRPAQAAFKSQWAPSAEAYFGSVGGFSTGDGVYLRLGIVAFVRDYDGVPCAVCEPIERDGKLSMVEGSRQAYYVPLAQLVSAGTIKMETAR